MRIVVAGAHGKIARLLHPRLVAAGHAVRGLVRRPEQAEALRGLGIEPVLCDLEVTDDLGGAVGEADVVVFAAGAGPGSGEARKWTVDRDGALKLLRAAEKSGVSRYVMISAMKVEEPRGNEVFRVYQQAKAQADAAVRGSDLDWIILRPGRLTDEAGTGRVSLAPSLPGGTIPRDDVAAVIAAVIETPALVRRQLDLVSGEDPIDDAIRKVLAI